MEREKTLLTRNKNCGICDRKRKRGRRWWTKEIAVLYFTLIFFAERKREMGGKERGKWSNIAKKDGKRKGSKTDTSDNTRKKNYAAKKK